MLLPAQRRLPFATRLRTNSSSWHWWPGTGQSSHGLYPCTPPEEELLQHSKHSQIFQPDILPFDESSSWNTFLRTPIGTCQAAIYPSTVIVIHFLHEAPQPGVISGPFSWYSRDILTCLTVICECFISLLESWESCLCFPLLLTCLAYFRHSVRAYWIEQSWQLFSLI